MVLSRPHIARLVGLIGLLSLGTAAEAQRPFASLDSFYQEETARRAFFDGFAAQADLAYLGAEPGFGTGAIVPSLGLALRFDYSLARQLDVAAIVDASSGLSGATSARAPLRVSWLIIKPYWHHGNTDYSVRLAIDPSGDSGAGFRQVDIAFLSSSDLAPLLSTDFAIGLRRAAVGFERLEITGVSVGASYVASSAEIIRSRATGTEVHMMWGYRFWLDPGGSHVFTTLSGEGMAYGVLRMRPSEGADVDAAPRFSSSNDFEGRLRGGVGRFNIGIEYSRPSFVVAPYASLPLFRWVELEGESRTWGPSVDHARLGVRFTVR